MSNSPYIVDVQAETFQTLVLENSYKVPVVVDFWAAWCNPCQVLMPLLQKLAEEFNGQFLLAKVNSDEQQALATQYGVRSLPTVKVFRNGEVVDEFNGALPEAAIREMLDRHIERESDKLAAQALELAAAGNHEEALALMQQAAEVDEDNYRVKLKQAQLLTELAQYDEASEILRKFPLDKQQDPEVTALLAQLEFAKAAGNAEQIPELEQRLAADGSDSEARYSLALVLIGQGEYEAGMEHLLQLMKSDRSFKDDAARKTMLMVFDMLGGSGPLVNQYRSQLYKLLY